MNKNMKTFYVRVYDNEPEIIEEDELMEQICDDIGLIRETTESILDSMMAICEDIRLIKKRIDLNQDNNPYF